MLKTYRSIHTNLFHLKIRHADQPKRLTAVSVVVSREIAPIKNLRFSDNNNNNNNNHHNYKPIIIIAICIDGSRKPFTSNLVVALISIVEGYS